MNKSQSVKPWMKSRIRAKKCMLYGEDPKLGLEIAKMDNTVTLAFSDALLEEPIQAWPRVVMDDIELKQFVAEFRDPNHGIKRIVISDLGSWVSRKAAEFCSKKKIDDLGDIAFGGGFSIVANKINSTLFEPIVSLQQSNKVDVFVTCRMKISEKDENGKTVEYTNPDTFGTVTKMSKKFFHDILPVYGGIVTNTKNPNVTKHVTSSTIDFETIKIEEFVNHYLNEESK